MIKALYILQCNTMLIERLTNKPSSKSLMIIFIFDTFEHDFFYNKLGLESSSKPKLIQSSSVYLEISMILFTFMNIFLNIKRHVRTFLQLY